MKPNKKRAARYDSLDYEEATGLTVTLGGRVIPVSVDTDWPALLNSVSADDREGFASSLVNMLYMGKDSEIGPSRDVYWSDGFEYVKDAAFGV